ncbi:MAG: DUF177 domain-containing protein [Alphaproteobacteria bacterium]|nr:DUF177 domain-containing protein [Alphaproteobacteria bacterium]
MNGQAPEFSRLISVSRLPPKGVEEALEAKPVERAALAKRFGLLELPVLKADLTVLPDSQAIVVSGTIRAEVVQRCVVTLEPIQSTLTLKVDVICLPEGSGPLPSDELEDEFEFFSEGKIDLGELVAQQLGVNIDPYPRKPEATLTQTEFGRKTESPSPLSQLSKAIKAKKNKQKP